MSKFAIMRVGKLKSGGGVKGMLKHNFRDIDTPNAKETLTENNEHLGAQSVEEGMRIYDELLPDKVRKNAVHALDYMITTSKEASPEAKEMAMTEAYNWIAEKHGKENIIMASKHRDETTPHIHIMVMPLDDRGKLNARHFVGGTKHKLSELQDEYYNKLKEKNVDLDRGIRGSRAKHQSVKQWHSRLAHSDKLNSNELNAEITASRELQNVADKLGGIGKKSKLEKLGLKKPKKETPEQADYRTIIMLRDKVLNRDQQVSELTKTVKTHESTIESNNEPVELMSKLQQHVAHGHVSSVVSILKPLIDKTKEISQEREKRQERQALARERRSNTKGNFRLTDIVAEKNREFNKKMNSNTPKPSRGKGKGISR